MRAFYNGLKKVTEFRVELNTLWKEDRIIAYDKKLEEFERKNEASVKKGHLFAGEADKLAVEIDGREFDLAALNVTRSPREILQETCEKLTALHKAYPFGEWDKNLADIDENLRQLAGLARNQQGYFKRDKELVQAEGDVLALRNNDDTFCQEVKRIQDSLGKIMFADKPEMERGSLIKNLEERYGQKGEADIAEAIKDQVMELANRRFALMRRQSLARFRVGHDRIILNFMAGNISAKAANRGLELIAAERKLNKVVRDIIVMCAKPKVNDKQLEVMDRRLAWMKKECDKRIKRVGRVVSEDMASYLFSDRASGTLEKLKKATNAMSNVERNLNIRKAESVGRKVLENGVHQYRSKLARELGKIK